MGIFKHFPPACLVGRITQQVGQSLRFDIQKKGEGNAGRRENSKGEFLQEEPEAGGSERASGLADRYFTAVTRSV